MTGSGRLNSTALVELLHYGAVLDTPSGAPALPFDTDVLEAAWKRRARTTSDHATLIREGGRIWRDVCQRVVEQCSYPLLVPLSAGLDSRAILAGLRDRDVPVHAVTYGVPGAFDYEIAPRVAQVAGADIQRIDLRDVIFDRSDLLALAAQSGRVSSLLDMYFNYMLAARFGSSFSYVNGYLGDELAGKNLSAPPSPDWTTACAAFARHHRAARSDVLTPDNSDPVARLPRSPFVSAELLSFDAQLYYSVRQQCLVRPVVCPPGYELFTPFTDPEWSTFMLGLPDKLRHDRQFFITLFSQIYPDLFALPTTASGGLPLGASLRRMRRYKRRLKRARRLRARLQRVLPWLSVPPRDRGWQYVDFPTLLRGETWLTALYADSMARLDDSDLAPWIDASGLLAAHRSGRGDHFKALNVLLNLDIVRDARPELLFDAR